MKSMTGFGASQGSVDAWHIKVDIKAVNQKNLDARIHMNRSWSWLEARLLKMVKAKIKRGRLVINVTLEPSESASADVLHVDEARFLATAKKLENLASMAGMEHSLTMQDVLVYKRLFERSSSSLDASESDQFDHIIAQAIERFDQSRAQEGAAISEMLQGHLDFLAGAVSNVQELRPKLLEGYRERLQERLDDLAKAHGIALEQERIIHEVILFSDRSDIAEEVQRATSHVAKIREVLESSGPHGKKLDFYLQEMIRETNTMASKSNFTALTDLVVQMKTAVEQMREQTANVE